MIVEDISDHFACLLILKEQNKSIKGPTYIRTRNLNEQKISDIVNLIQQNDWKEILTPLSVNDGFNMFHSLLLSTIDRIAPEKEVRLNIGTTPRDPWITKELLQNIQKQKKLYIEQLNDTAKSSQYIAHRNKTKQDIRKAKITYFREKCNKYKQDSRKLWKLIHSILNKRSTKQDSITAIKRDGIPRYNPPTITDELCKHFACNGETFANKIPPSVKDIGFYLNNIPQNKCSIFLDPTTATEICTLRNELVPKNSSGYDNLSNKLIEKILPALMNPLTILFNKSLIDGVFLEAMKKADVVPLYKAKDHQESNNYRPISLLLTLSKLLEKIMYKRIYHFLESSGQIYKSQYGFRTAHSCENTISELVSEIIKGKQDGMYTLAVFLDLSKAFDSLEHEVLLSKMYKYGIRGVTYDWFESYLTGRQMRVKCKVTSSGRTEYSNYMNVTYGTPQGSCLGPLIFLIFTNDLYRHLVYSSAILFADDTTLYKTHRNLVYLKWCLEDDLSTLSDWFASNKLTLNLDKTVSILFQKNNKHMEIELKIKDMIISSKTETKFLGMWLDQSLNWQNHIQKLILKVKRNKYLLNNGKHLMDQSTKKLVYHSHIASHIQYGILLWGNNTKKEQINKIQKIQTKCLELVVTNQRPTNLNKHLGILSIEDMIALENMKFGYKLVHQMLPQKIVEICCEDNRRQSLVKTHQYGTRNKIVPNLPKNMNKLYRESFLCKGPQSWLTLSVETREKPTLKTFIKKCKETLLTH